MLYHSTRNKNEVMSSREAVLQGLARDGGLFVTDDLDRAQIDPASLRGSYMDTAKRVFRFFLTTTRRKSSKAPSMPPTGIRSQLLK